MNFLYPQFLWALLALAIPVIIHLFHFRRYKTVFFSNLRFLKNLQEQTQQQQKLKHLLVLISRLLALTFLILAFAQPYFNENNPEKLKATKAISVFIDNSFSMTNNGGNGELLENAKAKARELALAHKESDKFQLITNDFEARHQRLVTRNDFIQLIDEVKPTFASRQLSDVLVRQQQALSKAGDAQRNLYLISDFQSAQTNAGEWNTDTTTRLNLIPLAPALLSNIYVDSCWFASPYIQLNQPANLLVRLRNAGENTIKNNSVILKINGQQKALGGFEIQGNSYTDVTLGFTLNSSGSFSAEVAVTDNPITFDDKLFLSFYVKKEVNILQVYGNQPNPYIHAVFASDNFCKVTAVSEKQIDYSAFNINQLVVLDGVSNLSSGMQMELTRLVNNGGSVLLIPPSADVAAAVSSHSEWLKSWGINSSNTIVNSNEAIERINLQSQVLADVFEKTPRNPDLPKILKYFNLNDNTSRGVEKVLSLRNDDAIWSVYKRGKGKIYVSAVPFDNKWSNLPEHALFVPLMLKTAYLSEVPSRLYYTLNKDVVANLPVQPAGKEKTFTLELGQNNSILPAESNGAQTQLYFNEQLKEAGNYLLKGSLENPYYLAMNYNRDESGMKFLTPEEIQELNPSLRFNLLSSDGKSISTLLGEQERGSRLWKLCIALALVFLLIEILLLKFYRP